MKFRIHKDFAKLWAGQTISEIGSRITREGLPFTALITLHASAGQMGVLSAVGSASVLVFGLAAGIAVDRLKKRPVMIWTDLARAGLLALIPLAAYRHALSMTLLIAIAVAAGALTVLFDVAYQSYLPALVEPEELLESNRRLSFSTSAAEMAGPALTGALVQAITAPLAIFVDALSFLVSAFSVWTIRIPEGAPVPQPNVALVSEALHGFQFIWKHPALRALLLRSATAFLSMGVIFPLYLLNAIRVIGMSTSALGIAIALGGTGSLLGAFLAPRLSRAYGLGPMFFGDGRADRLWSDVHSAIFGISAHRIPMSMCAAARGRLRMDDLCRERDGAAATLGAGRGDGPGECRDAACLAWDVALWRIGRRLPRRADRDCAGSIHWRSRRAVVLLVADAATRDILSDRRASHVPTLSGPRESEPSSEAASARNRKHGRVLRCGRLERSGCRPRK